MGNGIPSDPQVVAELVKWLAQMGVGGAFAAFLFMFYRRDVQSYTELWKAQADDNRKMTDRVIVLVETTSACMTKNTEVLMMLHHRVDRLDLLRVVGDERAHANDDERDRPPADRANRHT